VAIGRSILFTAAGQSRTYTGFPLGASRKKRRQQTCHKVICGLSHVNRICCALAHRISRARWIPLGPSKQEEVRDRRVFYEIASPSAQDHKRQIAETDPAKRREAASAIRHVSQDPAAMREAMPFS
jgi:hypothetical protein